MQNERLFSSDVDHCHYGGDPDPNRTLGKAEKSMFLTNESGFGKKTNKNVSLRYQSNLSVSVSVAKAVFSKEDGCSNAIIRGEKIAHCFLETRNKH